MGYTTGIDIGTTAVRVVKVSGLDSSTLAKVTNVAVVPLHHGAVVNGRIQDPAQVAYAVRIGLKEAKASAYGPIFGISSPAAAVGWEKLPEAVKRSDWAGVLRLQDIQISPNVPAAASSLSFQPLGDVDSTGHRTLLVAAARKVEVATVAEMCRLAKVTPRAVDLAGAATMRALSRVASGSEDVVTVVDIGASKTTVVTRRGTMLRFIRTLETGGEELTRSIKGATNGSFEDAEHRKKAMRIGAMQMATATAVVDEGPTYGDVKTTSLTDERPAPSDVAALALDTAADNMIELIAEAIASDSDAHPDSPAQGIVLAGGGSLLQGLRERLAERVGIQTVGGRPWATFAAAKISAPAGVDQASLELTLTTAIGLGMWKESK